MPFVAEPDPNSTADPLVRAESQGHIRRLGKANGRQVYRIQTAEGEGLRDEISRRGGMAVGKGQQSGTGLASWSGQPDSTMAMQRTDQPGTGGRYAMGGASMFVSGPRERAYAAPGVIQPTGGYNPPQAKNVQPAPFDEAKARENLSRMGMGGSYDNFKNMFGGGGDDVLSGSTDPDDTVTAVGPELGGGEEDDSVVGPGFDSLASKERGQAATGGGYSPRFDMRDAYLSAMRQQASHVAQGPPVLSRQNIDPEDIRHAGQLDWFRKNVAMDPSIQARLENLWGPSASRLEDVARGGPQDRATAAWNREGEGLKSVLAGLSKPEMLKYLEGPAAPDTEMRGAKLDLLKAQAEKARREPAGKTEKQVAAEERYRQGLMKPDEEAAYLKRRKAESEATGAGTSRLDPERKRQMEQSLLEVDNALRHPATSEEEKAQLEAGRDKLQTELYGARYVEEQRGQATVRAAAEKRESAAEARRTKTENREEYERGGKVGAPAFYQLRDAVMTAPGPVEAENVLKQATESGTLDEIMANYGPQIARAYHGERPNPENIKAMLLSEWHGQHDGVPKPQGITTVGGERQREPAPGEFRPEDFPYGGGYLSWLWNNRRDPISPRIWNKGHALGMEGGLTGLSRWERAHVGDPLTRLFGFKK